jgi:hypothetical protein
MRARDYWKAVTVDRSDLLDRFLAVLREERASTRTPTPWSVWISTS